LKSQWCVEKQETYQRSPTPHLPLTNEGYNPASSASRFELRVAAEWRSSFVRLSLGQTGEIVHTHPCPARLHFKYLEYVFFPQNRLDDWDLALHPCHLLNCVAVAKAPLGAA